MDCPESRCSPVALVVAGTFTSATAAGNGAQRVEWSGFVFDYTGTSISVPVSCTTLITPSGNANQVCHGENAANPTGSAVHHSFDDVPFPCFPQFPIIPFPQGPSENWHEVISASGQVSFTCRF
jgi:hypothetical protein